MRFSRVLKALAVLLPMSLGIAAPAEAAPPAKSLLTPDNHVLVLVDHQPQMAFATRSIDIAELRNNVTGLAKSAKTFSGPIFPEIQAVFGVGTRCAGRPARSRWCKSIAMKE